MPQSMGEQRVDMIMTEQELLGVRAEFRCSCGHGQPFRRTLRGQAGGTNSQGPRVGTPNPRPGPGPFQAKNYLDKISLTLGHLPKQWGLLASC